MGKYLNLQNKALHQGLYLAYVSLPSTPVVFTTNGHVMVRGKVHEVKPLKDQADRRSDTNIIALTDSRWLSDFKDMEEAELQPVGTDVRVGDRKYQGIYVEYIMARYPVMEWKTGGIKLVALDENEHIIAVISPIERPVEVKDERVIKQTEERGNA